MNDRLTELTRKYTEYDMIRKHTELPDFPEYRARLLLAFLNKNEHLQASSELYALVTSLLQLGLDVHDRVAVTSEIKEKKAARSRQMKVLAGDYFSSRFYQLLAQAGQIELIRRLSGAICEVNRLKMNLYMMMKQLKITAEEYIQQSVAIRSQLFLSFATLMEEMYHKLWPDVLNSFTRCEVLFQEIFRAESMQDFAGSWGYWHILQNGSKEERRLLQAKDPDVSKLRLLLHKHRVNDQLYQLLEGALQQLNLMLGQVGSDKLAQELRQLEEPFHHYRLKPRVLEEI